MVLGGRKSTSAPNGMSLPAKVTFVALVPGACAVLSEDVKHHNVMLTGIRPPSLGEAAVLQYRARALVH
jgi:hypothetical protein